MKTIEYKSVKPRDFKGKSSREQKTSLFSQNALPNKQKDLKPKNSFEEKVEEIKTPNCFIKNLNENVNFVIIGSDKADGTDTSLIIQELNSMNVGVEIMNMSSACSSHNILLSEKRKFLSFFLFK